MFSELFVVDAVHWHMIRAAQMLVAMVREVGDSFSG